MSRTQVAYDIATSVEYRTDYIEADYQAFLGRAADPGGLSTWLSAFDSGVTDEQVDAAILGSAEFFTDAGSTDSGFLNAVYQVLLGRPVDLSGLSIWNSDLSDGLSRTQVAYDIDTSNESRIDKVEAFYRILLNRSADPGGISTWVGALKSGATDEQVLAGIAGSQEFYNDAAGLITQPTPTPVGPGTASLTYSGALSGQLVNAVSYCQPRPSASSQITVNGTLNGTPWVLFIQSYDGQTGVWQVLTGQAGGATGLIGNGYAITATYPATVSGITQIGWTEGATIDVELMSKSGQTPAGDLEVQGTINCGMLQLQS